MVILPGVHDLTGEYPDGPHRALCGAQLVFDRLPKTAWSGRPAGLGGLWPWRKIVSLSTKHPRPPDGPGVPTAASWPASTGCQEARSPQPTTIGVLAPGWEDCLQASSFGTSSAVPWGPHRIPDQPRLWSLISEVIDETHSYLIENTANARAVKKKCNKCTKSLFIVVVVVMVVVGAHLKHTANWINKYLHSGLKWRIAAPAGRSTRQMKIDFKIWLRWHERGGNVTF